MTTARQLAAILAADVVGSSRLMTQDEAGTAKAVRERRDAAQPIPSKPRRPHRQDDRRRACCWIFLRCRSVRMRHRGPTQIGSGNTGVPEGTRILYRMGVNLSAVLIHGEDILGDGVNIAARLKDVSGGIGVIGLAPILGFALVPTRRKMRPASAAKNKEE